MNKKAHRTLLHSPLNLGKQKKLFTLDLRPFILYCLFNEPPELNMFVGGGNKNKNLNKNFYVVGQLIVVHACVKTRSPQNNVTYIRSTLSSIK